MAPFVIGSQKPEARNTTPLEQRLGQATSVVMPLVEMGAIGYITWVLCYLICVQYLINPPDEYRQRFNVQPRRSTGIALIAVYAILLLVLLISWMRLIQVIWSKTDILPYGDTTLEKKDIDSQYMEQYDAYISDYQGNPLFCQKCHIYKPGRTHHCKELGQCVRKMDHYCPWAGGIIAESSHKPFMQTLMYAAVYITYAWIIVAVFFAERRSKTGSSPGTWIGALAVGLFFCIFACTMTWITGYNLAISYTSVEAIKRGGVSNIAFRITKFPTEPTKLHTPPSSSENNPKSEAEDDWPVLCVTHRSNGKSFVVMQTMPFQHPWAANYMLCWKDTMGESVLDWFLPLKHSPCKQKSRSGEFRWGELVYDMAQKYQKDNPGAQLALLEGRR